MISRAQRVVGARAATAPAGSACRDSVSRSMPGIQPTVEIAVRRWRDRRRRAGAAQAASTLSRFIIGSPMPMNTTWSTRLDAAEVQRLVEDLGRRQVAAELHRAGRAERAGQRAARLRGQAQRAAPVAVAHQHRLDRPAVVRVEQRLDRAVARRAPRAPASASRTAPRAASRVAQRGRAGSSSPRSRPRRARPTPTPAWRGTAGSPAIGERAVEQLEVHAP